MSWKYSDPLSGALLAAAAVTNPNHRVGGGTGGSDIGLGSSSLYRQYYSGFDPIISRYETRRNQPIYRPTHAELLDDIDDLTLEMEAENLFGAASRRSHNISTYVPTATTTSLFTSNNSLVDHADKATGTSFIEDDEEARSKRRRQQQQAAAELNHKASQIPKQPPPKTTNHTITNNNHNHTNNKNQVRNGHHQQHHQNGYNNENHAKQPPPQPKQVRKKNLNFIKKKEKFNLRNK